EGVGRGYMESRMTAERYVPDPYSGESGARMYRTGDWGKWKKDGRIELVGRKDEQIKIRGYRVELGEHEGVRQAVVVMREYGAREEEGEGRGEKKLVAYVLANAGEEVKWRELRGYLKERLPEYMVPVQYVKVEEFPLTESGKVDRRGLAEVEGEGNEEREYEAPEGEVERRLAGIWAEVLKVERVGRQDNF